MCKDSNFKFQQEFEELFAISRKLTGDNDLVANFEGNRPKNRFVDVLPFNENRVKLKTASDGSDYINASFIKGFNFECEYIATQGPISEKEATTSEFGGTRKKKSTVIDFCQMIWDYNVPIIVTLTPSMEGGKVKCAQFWLSTSGESLTFGPFILELESCQKNEVFTKRTMLIKNGEETRSLTQFFFHHWPDFDAPKEATDVLEFAETVRKAINSLPKPNNSTTVVHCSAGVGRTGTFIAIDLLLQQLANNCENMDVFGCILQLREQRVRMVQTEAQYILAYKCLQIAIKRKLKNNVVELPSQLESLALVRPHTNNNEEEEKPNEKPPERIRLTRDSSEEICTNL